MRLEPIAPAEYVRAVLPYSQTLWAGSRSFDAYVDEFRAIAASAWGRRRFRTIGLYLDGALVASLKRYERVLRCGERTFRAAGIGAVFTPEPLRARGYATALLGAFLDAERAGGTDVAYLFSDIGPRFYEQLGFIALPSRTIALRSEGLSSARIDAEPLQGGDAGALRAAFEALDRRRPFAFARTPLDWEWQRLRATSREHAGQPVCLGVRRGRSIAAYVLGRRVPSADAFVLDELGYTRDEDALTIAPLLRAAAGDLRRVQGPLPPQPARLALPRGAVRARHDAIPMLLPLSAAFRAAHRRTAPSIAPDAGVCWSTDHV